MFKTYLKTAWRSIVRNKVFSVINITGLAIGIAASLLLFIVVKYEMSYDTFQKNYKNIYRVVTQDKYPDGVTYNSGIPVPALDALRAEFPNVQFAAIDVNSSSQVTIPSTNNRGGNKFIEDNGFYFCEPQFFSIFNYNWLSGDASVLKDPNSVVLGKKTAEKYFGSWQQAMGKTILLNNAVSCKVNGIVDNPPANSDFRITVIASYITVKDNASVFNFYNDWHNTSSNSQIFALLPASTKMADINKALLQFSKTHYISASKNSVKTNFLQPFSDMHFDRRFESFGDHITSKSTLLTLSFIGILIVLMACVNFINLSTAIAVNRSKEVGIRKVLGSNRDQLFGQIMSETAAIVFLAVLAATGIVYLALPYIKHIASIEEQLNLFTFQTISMLVGIGLLVTLLAGLYPSFVMSKFNPIKALKNKLVSANVQGVSLRRGLVILQFSISQVLIIATAVAVSQMSFIQNADLGFNKEAVLLLSGNTDSISLAKQSAFKQQLLQIPGVQAVSFSSDAPSSDNNWSTNFRFNHLPSENFQFQLSLKFADPDYIRTFGLQLVAGRNLLESDTAREMVINETLVKKLKIKNPNDVIGKTIGLNANQWIPIVGVVKDFKTSSLREEIKPIAITSQKAVYWVTAVKMKTAQLQKTVAAIQNTWDRYYPDYAYSGAFFDENIAKFYRQETQLSLLYKIFAGLAIFISCLGLYGLVSFMAIQKTKEVGIRKVLGASVTSLIQLFSKEFTILIIISFFIAAPVAWFMMHNWLNNFVYRISLGIGFFAFAIIGSILIAWLTVGFKALRAALANPVKALRSE